MTYTQERDEFVDRMAREGLPLEVTIFLLRSATTLQRLAELACSSDAADRDRVPCPASKQCDAPCLCDFTNVHHELIPRIRVQDWQCKQRVQKALPRGWGILMQGDPRGAVLRIVPPSYMVRNTDKDRHNQEGLYVPARPSGLYCG